jgi:uncharacterized membrane protein
VLKNSGYDMKNWHALRHKLFHVGIILKGIDGVLEIIGGFLVLIISPQTLNRIVYLLTQHELIEDPRDVVANYLIYAAKDFSVSDQLFGFSYLLSHGVIKIILIVSLWKRKLWSYPVAIIFFALFGVYQMYKYYLEHAPGWIVLTVIDVFVIILTWMEYRDLKGIYKTAFP